jgi:putative flippase GtrA
MDGDARSVVSSLTSGVRFGQFVSVGAVGATVESIILAILTAGFGVVPQIAKVVGAEASITLMFLLNEQWTFSEAGAAGIVPFVRRLLRSHFVRLGGLVVGFAVLTLLTDYTSIQLLIAGADFWPTVANGIGIGCGMVLNYLAESLFTWRIHR